MKKLFPTTKIGILTFTIYLLIVVFLYVDSLACGGNLGCGAIMFLALFPAIFLFAFLGSFFPKDLIVGPLAQSGEVFGFIIIFLAFLINWKIWSLFIIWLASKPWRRNKKSERKSLEEELTETR